MKKEEEDKKDMLKIEMLKNIFPRYINQKAENLITYI